MVEGDVEDRTGDWQSYCWPLSCVPRLLLLTASPSRAPSPGTAQLAKGEGYWHGVVLLLNTQTPGWRLLCNTRRVTGQDLSHAMFRTRLAFQAPLERLHPVFSKTKSLFILPTNTTKKKNQFSSYIVKAYLPFKSSQYLRPPKECAPAQGYRLSWNISVPLYYRPCYTTVGWELQPVFMRIIRMDMRLHEHGQTAASLQLSP